MRSLLEPLYARTPRGIDLGLDRMFAACARAKHPERAYRTVHIAGTNGKGSTCAMLASALARSGLRTGLYTSPHLARFEERIRIDGVPINAAELEHALGMALADPDLTFFECATFAALVAFRDRNVDIAVLEVGLGGRLDATNVIEAPDVTVITRIAFDHEDKLGSTLALIAGEKAGITKRGVPLVLGLLDPEAEQAITTIANERGAPIVHAMNDAEARTFTEDHPLRLGGLHQRDNARVAYVTGKILGVHQGALESGIAEASWPGRLESITARDTTFLLDAAHNPDGAEALADALRVRPKVMVFGALADKRWREMLDILAPLADRRIYAEPQGRAAAPQDALMAAHSGAKSASLEDALTRAAKIAGPEGTVLVCGSIYLVGAARALLVGEPMDPIVAL